GKDVPVRRRGEMQPKMLKQAIRIRHVVEHIGDDLPPALLLAAFVGSPTFGEPVDGLLPAKRRMIALGYIRGGKPRAESPPGLVIRTNPVRWPTTPLAIWPSKP